MIGQLADYANVILGILATGLLGIIWHDIRNLRKDQGNYVKTTDCIEKRGMCGTMRQAMAELVNQHGDSLGTMHDLLRGQAEGLARLDEQVKSIKDVLKTVVDGLKKFESDTIHRD
jgi:hypothetical protein